MARYAARHVVGGDPIVEQLAAAAALRDRLTRECLAVAASGVERRNVEVLGFDPHWWDGQAYDACLVVLIDGRPARVIETAGAALIVPFTRRGALQAIADRDMTIDLTVPSPRLEITPINVDGDFVRCSGELCCALLPIEFVGNCARCGQSTVLAESQI